MEYARCMVVRWCLAGIWFLASCTGTETTNPTTPLRDFEAGGCKKGHETEDGIGLVTEALTTRDPYAGLDCIVYEVAADRKLRVDIRNIQDGCHVTHEGHARVTGANSLRIAFTNPTCIAAGCGSCTYDAVFEVDLAPFEQQSSLTLSFVIDQDESCRPPEAKPQLYWMLEVPLQEGSHGASCKYASYFGPPVGCGTLNMPCTTSDRSCGFRQSPTDPGTCEGELSCRTAAAHPNSVCMQLCNTDQDCPLPDALHCIDGACQL
jgi:hypothetical protein